MSSRPAGVRVRALALAYPLFYRLPHRMRVRLIRLVSPTFTVGAVVLVRDAEAPEPGRRPSSSRISPLFSTWYR